MGKLLFVNTNRINGIFGVVICAAIIACGVGLGIEGTYAGLFLVPIGLIGGKYCLKLATTRSEIYEQGFVTTSCFGRVSARYADLKSISRYGVRVNGVLNTNILFVTQSGERATVMNESIRPDGKMAQLIQQSCEALAGAWMKTLERQKEVAWIEKENSPILRIRKDGVVFKGNSGADEFIALNELQLKSKFAANVDVCRGEAKVLEINSAHANFFVGQMLVAMLLENQSRPVGTESVEPPKRAMSARANT